ncbi:Zn-dependent hydrolase [Phytohabitans kaempferiae]|uniref:Zn-dependent hydrolase n=1 Tax=Phytohabitans kaempferiae TaxID=1620943 RepID=A0ABV6MA94_9ACTN
MRNDPDEVWQRLQRIAQITTGSGPGVTRLAYTESEREAHRLVAGWFEELGLQVYTDPVGNTIAERAGQVPGLPAIGTGSHLDSVPEAGRFDGIVGVVAAVEVARRLVGEGIEHAHPFRFVVFAAEEGARFGQACIGSKAAAGQLTTAALDELQDAGGVKLGDAMRAVGLSPDRLAEAAWDGKDWAGFVELHIEQGQVLETAGTSIGLVDVVSGSTRLELTVRGQASHTGGTPMHLRSDALAAAAEVVLTVEELANRPQCRGTRATVGRLVVEPGSITTIPGTVTFAVDVRDVDSDRQRAVAAEIIDAARSVGARRDVLVDLRLLADTSPVVLPARLRQLTTRACRDLGLSYRTMPSGASHDCQMINAVVPSALIFVPSRSGLSHVHTEWTEPAQIVAGIDALAASMLLMDAKSRSIRVRTARAA